MKAKSIAVENYQRVMSANIALHAPILFLAGPNEAGKTSMADAVYHAVNGEARRVKLKKDFGDLVHDGQKRGMVSIELTRQGVDGMASVLIPGDKRTCDFQLPPIYPYLLDSKRFPRLDENSRRSILFDLAKVRITGKSILEKLREKGADPKKAADIGSVLLAGFDAAHTEATNKASEARGSWRAVTGEAYGSKKAPEWKAPKVKVYEHERLPTLKQEVIEAQAKVQELTRHQGELAAQRRQFNDQELRRTAAKEKADGLERAKTKLATDQTVVDEWQAKVDEARALATGAAPVTPLTCPHCAGLVELKDGKLHQHTPPAKVADAKSKALLPEYEATLTRVIGTRDNSKRDKNAAEAAAAVLHDLQQNGVINVEQSEIDKATADLQTAQQHLNATQSTVEAIEKEIKTIEQADKKTAEALGYHNDVEQWVQIAEWLAPSGIQSEFMTKALEPFNIRLERTHMLTGWGKVSIDADMTIRVDGRAFSLCSESARWRAEAAITEALSFVSGERMFMLDELDVLVGDTRLTFLKWMHVLAANNEIDTAIIIGSFKAPPECPPTFQVEWCEAGHVGQQLQEAA